MSVSGTTGHNDPQEQPLSTPGGTVYSKTHLTLPVEEQPPIPIGTALRVLHPSELGGMQQTFQTNPANEPEPPIEPGTFHFSGLDQPASFAVEVIEGEFVGARLSVNEAQVSRERPEIW